MNDNTDTDAINNDNNYVDEPTDKYTIDNVIYSFVHSKENEENKSEVKHEII